ncbi:MAG: hypothetical protein U9R08_03490 [Nanoarchaeota archaeon]|nr:hypothetical protein [Nanoarchaeota archaeon]
MVCKNCNCKKCETARRREVMAKPIAVTLVVCLFLMVCQVTNNIDFERSLLIASAIDFETNRDAAGLHNPIVDYILIKSDVPTTALYQIANHEIGHAIHKRINKKLKREWIEISKNSSGYVSDYAETNQAEDFAETWEYLISCNYNDYYGKKLREIDPAKYEFMMNIITKHPDSTEIRLDIS